MYYCMGMALVAYRLRWFFSLPLMCYLYCLCNCCLNLTLETAVEDTLQSIVCFAPVLPLELERQQLHIKSTAYVLLMRRDTLCRQVHWMVYRYVKRHNLEIKILEILSPTDGGKKIEIDCKNLEISEICSDEKSRDSCFLRNVNLEKIFLYDGPKEVTKPTEMKGTHMRAREVRHLNFCCLVKHCLYDQHSKCRYNTSLIHFQG